MLGRSQRRQLTWPASLVFLIVVSLLVAACGGGSQKKQANGPIHLTFTTWTSSAPQLAMLKGIADEFHSAHPNVTVSFTSITYADYLQKVGLQLTGSEPPDAGWIGSSQMAGLASSNALINIEPALKADPAYDFSDILAPSLEPYTWNNQLLAVPFSTSPMFLVYNKQLFQSAGVETPDTLYSKGDWTWDALRDLSKELAGKVPSGKYAFDTLGQSDLPTYSDPYDYLPSILFPYGAKVWDLDKGVCLLDQPAAVQAITLYHNMIFVDKSAVPPGVTADFFSGQSAMTLTQLSQMNKLQSAPFEWGVLPVPAGPAGTVVNLGWAGVGVFKASHNSAMATEFVKFMTNPSNTLKQAAFFPPARQAALSSEAFSQANPLITSTTMESVIGASIQKGETATSPADIASLRLTVDPIFDRLWTADANIPSTLSAICKAMQPFLKPT